MSPWVISGNQDPEQLPQRLVILAMSPACRHDSWYGFLRKSPEINRVANGRWLRDRDPDVKIVGRDSQRYRATCPVIDGSRPRGSGKALGQEQGGYHTAP